MIIMSHYTSARIRSGAPAPAGGTGHDRAAPARRGRLRKWKRGTGKERDPYTDYVDTWA